MERGKRCQLSGRSVYNHQTWRDGRNELRYVSKSEVEDLEKDIVRYQVFTKLAEQYTEEVIRVNRRQREKKKHSEKAN